MKSENAKTWWDDENHPDQSTWPATRLFGWAPGRYTCTCSCGARYMGDKRSTQCFPCADKMPKECHFCGCRINDDGTGHHSAECVDTAAGTKPNPFAPTKRQAVTPERLKGIERDLHDPLKPIFPTDTVGDLVKAIKECCTELDALKSEVAQFRTREKTCATMDQAEKVALVRMGQEIAAALGLDDPSPAKIVESVRAQLEARRVVVPELHAGIIDELWIEEGLRFAANPREAFEKGAKATNAWFLRNLQRVDAPYTREELAEELRADGVIFDAAGLDHELARRNSSSRIRPLSPGEAVATEIRFPNDFGPGSIRAEQIARDAPHPSTHQDTVVVGREEWRFLDRLVEIIKTNSEYPYGMRNKLVTVVAILDTLRTSAQAQTDTEKEAK